MSIRQKFIKSIYSIVFVLLLVMIFNTKVYAAGTGKGQPLYESPDYIANSKGYENINIHQTSSKKTTIKNVDESESYKTLYWYARYSEIDSNNSNKGYSVSTDKAIEN